MKCRQCRQPGSPLNNLLTRLDGLRTVSVLSACAGYRYEKHHNIPDKPFILFSASDLRTLENLWRGVFSRLSVPTYIMYNGSKQFLFEIDLPPKWPNRDEMLTSVWAAIDSRMKEYDE